MKTMRKVISIFDIGKTNKKLYLFDEKFKVVFRHEEPFPVITDEDDFECDDIDLITSWIANELTAQTEWIKQEKKEIADRVKTAPHFPQYLSFSLTGKICSEPTSIGCHTMICDFDNMSYHPWINDSSASLVSYLKTSESKFIPVSTGTWCIILNPFNGEPMTANQLARDCLCYLTPMKQQVKSSRLFMGHFHEVYDKKSSIFFDKPADFLKKIKYSESLADILSTKYNSIQVFFPDGNYKVEETPEKVDLSLFSCYEEAYAKSMIDLTGPFLDAYDLVSRKPDFTELSL